MYQLTNSLFHFFIPFAVAASIVLSTSHSIYAAEEQARYSITVHALGPDSSPLPETKLWVVLDRKVHTGISDSDGVWVLENIQAAPITVIAHKDGHSLAGRDGYIIQNETIKLQLRKPEELIIQTITPKNVPIAGALLRELRINDRFSVDYELLRPHGFPSFYSDEEGIIRVPYLPRFGYGGIKVSHRKYMEGVLPTVPVGKPIPLVMLQGGKVRGRVTTPDGLGAAYAQVTIFRTQDTQNITLAEVLTDQDGFYQVSAPMNSFLIAARHTKYAIPDPKVVTLSQSRSESIIDHELLTPYHLSGIALDDRGEPVPRVWISYRSNHSTFNESLTNNKGEYSIIAREGKGQLHISPPPGLMTEIYPIMDLTLNQEKSIHLQPIKLKPLPTTTGTILSQNEQPGVPIILQSTNVEPPVWTTTDSQGHFSVQLDSMPDTPIVKWVAEHPLRFQRMSFETTLDAETQEPVNLKPFRPDLKKDSTRSLNDLSLLVDKPASPWECDAWFNLPDGMESFNLEELKGKIVVLVLWGGFGIKSQSERRMGEFNAYSKAYEGVDNVVFLGIHDASSEPIEVQRTINNWGITFPIGRDADPFVSFDLYRVHAIPQTVIIDDKGVVRFAECDGRIPELIKSLRRKI